MRKAATSFLVHSFLRQVNRPKRYIGSADEQSCHPWVLVAKVVQGGDASELDRVLTDLQAQGGEATETWRQIQNGAFVPQVHRASEDA